MKQTFRLSAWEIIDNLVYKTNELHVCTHERSADAIAGDSRYFTKRKSSRETAVLYRPWISNPAGSCRNYTHRNYTMMRLYNQLYRDTGT